MIVRQSSLSLSAAVEGLPVIGYHNVVTPDNVASETTEAGFPISNVGNPSTYLKWKGTDTTSQELITITTGSGDLLDYVAIAGHNFGSGGIEVSLEITGTVIPAFTPTDDCPLILQFTPQVAATIILGLEADTVAPEMAVLYVGTLLTMERSIKIDVEHMPLNLGRKLKVVNGMSESGNFLGRVVLHQFNESKAEFAHITPEWYRASFDPFILAAQEAPFFWAWNPDEQPDDVGFAWLVNDPEPTVAPATRRMSVDLEMRGISCV